MLNVIDTTVLSVGLNGQFRYIAGLPLRFIRTDNGKEAIQWFRQREIIDLFVSMWDLPDMADGSLIKRVKATRPWLPTIVLLDEPYNNREIIARQVGVIAVLPCKVSGHVLRRIVSETIGIDVQCRIDYKESKTMQ